MFERFTEKAIKVIMLGQEESRRLGHNFFGTEQMLLGLLGEGTGIASKALKSMGVNLKDARVEVEKLIGRGSGFVVVEITFTPRAKRVLELSWDEARQLGHNYIGTEHLLLGLIREGEGVAMRVLKEGLGVDTDKLAVAVHRLLAVSGAAAQIEEKEARQVETKKVQTMGYGDSLSIKDDAIVGLRFVIVNDGWESSYVLKWKYMDNFLEDLNNAYDAWKLENGQ